MSKIETPQKPKHPKQTTESETYSRGYLPMWCRGIMGGCVNCGGCI